MRALLALALAVLPTAVTPPAPGTGVKLCSLSDPRITESSGLVASSTSADVLYTHNDSGDSARFFAIGTDCRTREVYDMAGLSAVDIEDVARGPGVLWFGDIGDNDSVRSSIAVDRVAEPAPAPATDHPPEVSVAATSFSLTYPDGPHNAETLLADPVDGRLYILTKSLAGQSQLFAAPTTLVAGKTNPLVQVATVTFTTGDTAGLGRIATLGQLAATGGDVSPDGSQVVLRTYAFAYVTTRTPGEPFADVFPGSSPGRRITVPEAPQGEGIAWSRDGSLLLTSSEGLGSDVDVVNPALPAGASPTPAAASAPAPAPTPAAAPAPSPSVAAPSAPRRAEGSPAAADLAGALCLGLLTSGAVLTRRRRTPRP